tara:strand:+ start:11 stop:1189 length:1179 start_codon:yes stop_codon:yes gene_type:complete
MAYIGKSIESGTFSVLDTSGNTYNGSNTTFSLGTQVGSPAQLLVSHDGVVQKPGTDYSLASGGTQITFSTAPASGASIFIVEISGAVGGPLDSDLNGNELILDADGDTSITADTDDQIDIKIGGADDFQFTANTFTANSGSSIVVPDGGLTFGSTAISSTAAELNILDGVTATASELNLLDGGTSVGSSITVADSDGFVVNDGGTMKTIPATDIKTYAAGGGLTFIKREVLSSNGDFDIDNLFTTSFANYIVVLEDFTCTVDSQALRMRMHDTSGIVTGAKYRFGSRYFQDDGNSDSDSGQDQTFFQIATNSEENAAFSGFNATLTFYRPRQNTTTRYSGHASFTQNQSTVSAAYLAGHIDDEQEMRGLVFFYSSGGIRSGATITSYGFNES